MLSTGDSESMEHDLKDIRYLSQNHKKLTTLINRVNEVSLWAAHEKQSRRKAVGVDGVSKDAYEEELLNNLRDLVERMKSFKYVPQPVRRTYIPKLNGKLRPLGIPAYEDKLVQSVMADILTDVYEPRFLNCSYGFRPGKSAHDVVRYISDSIFRGKVNYVLEADIKGFFDNLDQKWLIKFLEHDIADKNFIRYIVRFLKAGVMENSVIQDSDKGTPQGGLISPVLANVYLHYVLDLWLLGKIKHYLRGQIYYARYADDFVIMFQYESDARFVMEELGKRLGKFGLELAADKTRILPFGRFKGTKDSFDFLGFTFRNGKSRKGKYYVCVHSSEKKLKSKRAAVKEWLRTRLTKPAVETLRTLNRKLMGHCNYYGVNGNWKCVSKFYWYVQESTMRMLRRRGQKNPIDWKKFRKLWDRYVAKPTLPVEIWGWKPTMV